MSNQILGTFWSLDDLRLFINMEVFFIYFLMSFGGFVFYKTLLKQISPKRHLNLTSRFRQVPWLCIFILGVIAIEWSIVEKGFLGYSMFVQKINQYSLFLGLGVLAFSMVRLFQIVIYCYLFFVNMRQGIPRLIANVLTFFFSIFLISVILGIVFKVNIVTLVTTSAVFSIILGLALQDTIGNLFAGVSLQIDQSLKIGDWVEIVSDSRTWVGQIQEITWRATYLQGFANEIYMVPNRVMASARITFQISENTSMRLSHKFRFGYKCDFEDLKNQIKLALEPNKNICSTPPVRVLLTESQESWIVVSVFYSIIDYSKRFIVADEVLSAIVNRLRNQNIDIQNPTLEILKPENAEIVAN